MAADNGQQQTSARRITVELRRGLALQLRLQGGSYQKIADTLKTQPGVAPKYDRTQAYKDVRSELDRLIEQNEETAARLRRLQHEQLNELHAKYWPLALRGDYAALDRVLNIMDKVARLYGLPLLNVNVAGKVEQSGSVQHTLAGSLDVQTVDSRVVIYIPDNGRDPPAGATP